MTGNLFFAEKDYAETNDKTFTQTYDRGEQVFTTIDKDGVRREYREKDKGGYTATSVMTSCYYNEFGDS